MLHSSFPCWCSLAEITEFLDDHFESVAPSTEEPQAGSTGLHYTQLYFDDAAGV